MGTAVQIQSISKKNYETRNSLKKQILLLFIIKIIDLKNFLKIIS